LLRLDQYRSTDAEAVAWLLVARLSLIFVSFPRLAGRLGTVFAPADALAQRAKSDDMPDQARVAEEIGWG
jgi:hypothetical protein